jgi:hypothetical protein
MLRPYKMPPCGSRLKEGGAYIFLDDGKNPSVLQKRDGLPRLAYAELHGDRGLNRHWFIVEEGRLIFPRA